MAMLCLFAALGAGIAYLKFADGAVQERIAAAESEKAELQGYSDEIKDLDATLEELKAQSGQLEEAINDRSYWVRLLADLNNKFKNDLVWLTVIEPLKNGKSLTPELVKGSALTEEAAANPAVTPGAAPGVPAGPAYEIRMKGLYRKNDMGPQVVYDFAKTLADSEFFAVENISENLQTYVKAEAGLEEDRYAYRFDIRLPLKSPMEFKK